MFDEVHNLSEGDKVKITAPWGGKTIGKVTKVGKRIIEVKFINGDKAHYEPWQVVLE